MAIPLRLRYARPPTPEIIIYLWVVDVVVSVDVGMLHQRFHLLILHAICAVTTGVPRS